MASGPITSLQIDGETMETVRDFIFWGSRITADGDCSHEKTLVPWKKSYDQSREHIKSRDITLPIKVHLVKAMVYPVVMYGCESWTIKKAERRRIDAFELRCWKRLLRVPWTARRSNESIVKEISPNIHWEDWWWSWNCNTFATWCKELTHLKRRWLWERMKVREGDNRRWGGWMASWTRQTWWAWVNPGVGDGQGGLACCSPWGHKESDLTERTELNWTLF